MWVNREGWERVTASVSTPWPDWVMALDLRSRREAGLNVGRRALSAAWGCSERKASTVLREARPPKPNAADLDVLRDYFFSVYPHPEGVSGPEPEWTRRDREQNEALGAAIASSYGGTPASTQPMRIEELGNSGPPATPAKGLQAAASAWLRDRLDDEGDWPTLDVALHQLAAMWSDVRHRIEYDLPGIHLDTMRRELRKLYRNRVAVAG